MRAWLVAIAIAGACTRATPPPSPSPSPSPATSTPTAPTGATNIARTDYVGPKVCGDCHPDQHAAWSQSLHRVMNARASDPGAVIGDFSGARVAYAGGEARFVREGGDYVMILARGRARVRYRVTRTIGRRGLQEYVGIADGRDEEVRLPFGWWPRNGGWYPQPYFDPWLGDEANVDVYAEVREPWAERCPWCHSTYPFAQRIARASGPRGLGHGLEQLFAARPGSDRLAVQEQVTTGISCESCHLGGRAHADDPDRASMHFVPRGAARREATPVLPAKFADERRDASIVDAVCAQCHSGPSPRLADGTALRNSSEAIDLGASPCRGIKCTDCHEPHRADARADEGRSIAACTHCHDALADRDAARAHAGQGHEHASCLDCHMPELVMGIDRFVRTHRIAVPLDRARLAEVAPNACNLCHLDRSLGWTLDALRDGWEVRLPPLGDVDTAAGELWLASARPAFRLIAAMAYARSPLGKTARAKLARGLADPLAYVRAWTKLALEQQLGHPLAFDPRAPAGLRARQLAALHW
ncbi:MAG: hypothetical protein ACM31C_14305 [Acidobacteriota bacterium]